MAVDNQRGIVRRGFEALELSGNGAHRNQLGTGDAGNLEFRGLTNVDQEQFFARRDAALDVLRSGF